MRLIGISGNETSPTKQKPGQSCPNFCSKVRYALRSCRFRVYCQCRPKGKKGPGLGTKRSESDQPFRTEPNHVARSVATGLAWSRYQTIRARWNIPPCANSLVPRLGLALSMNELNFHMINLVRDLLLSHQ